MIVYQRAIIWNTCLVLCGLTFSLINLRPTATLHSPTIHQILFPQQIRKSKTKVSAGFWCSLKAAVAHKTHQNPETRAKWVAAMQGIPTTNADVFAGECKLLGWWWNLAKVPRKSWEMRNVHGVLMGCLYRSYSGVLLYFTLIGSVVFRVFSLACSCTKAFNSDQDRSSAIADLKCKRLGENVMKDRSHWSSNAAQTINLILRNNKME